jgi:hypothetical protein
VAFSKSPAEDLLAAVVLHVLLSEPRQELSLEQIVLACERDLTVAEDLQSVSNALRGLLEDGLVGLHGERFAATRAAIRAHELRF